VLQFSKQQGVRMKMIMGLVFALSGAAAFAQTYTVDTTATKIEWVGKKVTGEHRGTIAVKSGTIVMKGEEIASGDILVDMKSMANTDITDKETNGKFIGHMTSPDFFDTAKYPEAKLVIKSSKKTAKGLEVTGDLTMIGQTHPITFIATDLKKTDTTVSAKSTLNVDRTKHGLKYGSGQFFKGLGDKMINDEFTLNITLQAKK
jgi:polyisoprenoid-binding protein YceI